MNGKVYYSYRVFYIILPWWKLKKYAFQYELFYILQNFIIFI